MDLEQEMQVLLHEENYLDDLIEKLSGLFEYKNLSSYGADAQKLLKKLENTKKNIQEKIHDLTDEMVILAEAYAFDTMNCPDTEFYFDTEE